MQRTTLDLTLAGEAVPAILKLPDTKSACPVVLLVHGYGSSKERMADVVGRALEKQGIASLAIDLPLHGARDGGEEALTLRNPLALVQKWRLAIAEMNAAVHYLAEHPAIDPRRIGLLGYSLGAFLSVLVASDNKLVRAVVLAAGGDLPERTPFAAIVRTIADPLRAVRALAGRPLLMVNGKTDRMVRPEQARTLFDAAGEPKELYWYPGGHWPPQPAVDYAASWLAAHLDQSGSRSRLA